MGGLFLYALGALMFGLGGIAATVSYLTARSYEGPANMVITSGIALACAAGFYGRLRTRRSAKAEEKRARDLLAEMAAGAMPEMLARSVLVRAGEKVYFAAPGELMKIQSAGFQAGTAGVSLRVAKGVTLRTGGIKGGAIKKLQAIARGELALLDTRMVFGGDLKSFEVPYSKLTHVEKLTDGLIVHAGDSSHMVHLLVAPCDVRIAHAVLDRVLSSA